MPVSASIFVLTFVRHTLSCHMCALFTKRFYVYDKLQWRDGGGGGGAGGGGRDQSDI